jgi:plastocyanin
MARALRNALAAARIGALVAAAPVAAAASWAAEMAGMAEHHAVPAAARQAADSASDTSAPDQIVIDNFSFGPALMTVARGTRITWINHDDEPHTIVHDGTPRLFKSAALDVGESFSFTFAEPGIYRYFCSIHPHMQGIVVVQ